MQDFGLTNLRDSQPFQASPLRTPETTKLEGALFELKREIEIKSKEREELVRELARLQETKSHKTKTMLAELRVMTNKRNKLAEVIKELSGVYFSLKGSKTKMEESYFDFANQEVSSIRNFYTPIMEKIREDLSKLSVKSKELDLQISFLADFSDYLTEFMQICEAEALQNRLRGGFLDEKHISIVSEEHRLAELRATALKMTKEADFKLRCADAMFFEADNIVAFFQGKADKEREFLKRDGERLTAKEKEIALREENVKKAERRLRSKEIELGTRYKILEKSERRHDIIKHDK